MTPPGKTTLSRMQLSALREQERIEISQDGRVRCGMQKAWLPGQAELRDDFAGIVRLIDIIMSDAVVLQRLQEKLAQAPATIALPADGDDLIALLREETPSTLRKEAERQNAEGRSHG